MKRYFWAMLCISVLGSRVQAQDGYIEDGLFNGAGSIGSSEPLYHYDDQERWKHGYLKEMPYYHGHDTFRPYNYHHVFGQSSTAQGFGMSPVMPYSQQFWHRYKHMTDLSQGNHEPVELPVPPSDPWNHLPKPIHETRMVPPSPGHLNYQPSANNFYGPATHLRGPSQPQPVSLNQNYPVAPVHYQNVPSHSVQSGYLTRP